MHRLKNMKETLVGCVQAQLANIGNIDTHELGEAVDMIKDLEQAMYYCAKVKALEEEEEERKELKKKHPHYYTEKLIPYYLPEIYPYERDIDKEMGRMYYSEGQPRNSRGEFMSTNRSRGSSRNYEEREVPFDFRDSREGRSPMSRRHYMESKEMHQDKEKKIKELERYMQELSQDIVEMIEDASPEEKHLLEKKMTHLTSKIAQLNANA